MFLYKVFSSILLFLIFSLGLNAQMKTVSPDREFGNSAISKINIPQNLSKVKAKNNSSTYTPKSVSFKKLIIQEDKTNNNLADYISFTDFRKSVFSFEETAQYLLAEAKEKMHINVENTSFDKTTIWKDKLGMEHMKMRQFINNIPVYAGEIIFHKKDNTHYLLNGKYLPTLNNKFPTKVKYTELESRKIIVETDLNKQITLDEKRISKQYNTEFKQWREELVYYSPQMKGEIIYLAWHISYYPNFGERMEYFVDASSGNIINKFSSICNLHDHAVPPPDGARVTTGTDLLNQSRPINTYEYQNNFFMLDASRNMYNNSTSDIPNDPVGAIWTIDAENTAPQNDNFSIEQVISSNNRSFAPEAVSAHYNGGKAYTYFKDVHHRESINGKGGNIVSIVNVAGEDGNSMGNAFWNGVAIFYGNGDNAFLPLGRGLDVAGHEMSHGVIQSTANLEYQGESGAMNESFADVFGSMIDRDDWQIGEDVVKRSAFPSGALRDMSNPHNGAQTEDYGHGWQPSKFNERYTGSEDNGGVHLNSGIPNHAFYLFANTVGKNKAEKVYYRALTTYLTKSSQFVDLRNAVIKSSEDLYGKTESDAAKNAFNQVGIGEGAGSNNQVDVGINPGEDLVMYSDETTNKISIIKADGTKLYDPLIELSHISKPSVTDAGDIIVFTGEDKKLYYILIDWETQEAEGFILDENPIWANVVISKDGNRVAAITDELNNKITVVDFTLNIQVDFSLYNPTFTDGIETGDVLYADAMEFDITGQYLMYDAFNRIEANNEAALEYWDIGFLQVWNNELNSWSLGKIEKLFAALPESVNVGNPTYAKNSPFIIALDYFENDENLILGVNTETGEIQEILSNTGLGYPSYSRSDEQMVYDIPFYQNDELTGFDIGVLTLNADKISSLVGSNGKAIEFSRWPVWFSNGNRTLSEVIEVGGKNIELSVFPNPTSNELNIELDNIDDKYIITITSLDGKTLVTKELKQGKMKLNLSSIPSGQYILSLRTGTDSYSHFFNVAR